MIPVSFVRLRRLSRIGGRKRRGCNESQDGWLTPAVGGREEGYPTNKNLFLQIFSWGGRLEDRIHGEEAEPDLSQRDSVEATAVNEPS